MIKYETKKEAALREQEGIMYLSECYRKGGVLNVTEDSTREYLEYAEKRLRELKSIISDSAVNVNKLKRSETSPGCLNPRHGSSTDLGSISEHIGNIYKMAS